jgi:hypothetical protein
MPAAREAKTMSIRSRRQPLSRLDRWFIAVSRSALSLLSGVLLTILLPGLVGIVSFAAQYGITAAWDEMGRLRRLELLIELGALCVLALGIVTTYAFVGIRRKLEDARLTAREPQYVEELFETDEPFEGRVYQRLAAELDHVRTSLRVLTVAALGEQDDPNDQTSFWNHPTREAFLAKLNQTINRGMNADHRFEYQRVYQHDYSLNATGHPSVSSERLTTADINSRAANHIATLERLRTASGGFTNRQGLIDITIVNSSRNTGFMLINDETMIIQTSSINSRGKSYISSLTILYFDRRDQEIRNALKRFNDLLRQGRATGVLYQYANGQVFQAAPAR